MNLDRYLRYGLWGGIFAVPFIPFLVTDSMIFPFITGKNIAFRVLAELLLGGWIILMLRDPSYRPRLSALLAAFAAFVGIVALADVLGANPLKSFFSNYERMEGFVTIAHLFAYFLVAGSVLSTEKLWHRFFAVSVGVSAVLGGIAVLQLTGAVPINQGSVRIDATLGNATYLAAYMLFHAFLALFLLVRASFPVALRWLLGAVFLFDVALLYLTATRGAILGLVGGLFLSALLLALFGREEPHLRKFAAGGVLLVLLLAGGFLAMKDSAFVRQNPILSRIASISLKEGETRLIVWGMALQGVKERPILGWGQENFNLVFNTHYDPRLYAQEAWFDRVHNTLFDWLIATGILGLLAYLSLFGAALFLLWRSGRPLSERAILTGLLAGYFFHNLFVFDNLTSYLLFVSVLAYLHATRKSAADQPALFEGGRSGGAAARTALPAVLVATLALMYVVNVKPVLASRHLLQALSPQEKGLEENLNRFKRALALDSLYGVQEIREQLAQAAVRVGTLDADLKIKQEFFDLAREEMAKQIETAPNDARFHLFLGSLLSSFRQYDAALPYLVRAHELSPRKQGILLSIGSIYLNTNQYGKALPVLREAFELAEGFEQARLAYAIGAIYAGESALARDLLLSAFGTVTVDDNQLLKAYFDTKQFDKVVAIWRERVERSPADPQVRISLSAAYLAAGERAKSIGELAKAIELNPSFKEQGEFLIREIRAGRNP